MKIKKLLLLLLTAALVINFSSSSAPALAAVVTTTSEATKSADGISLMENHVLEPVGQSSVKVWTFVAKKSGTYKIVYTYSRAQSKQNQTTITYKIKVGKKASDAKDTIVLTDKKVNKLSKNQKFSIALLQNGSTGYSWSYVADKKAFHLNSESESNISLDVKAGSDPVIVDLTSVAPIVGAPDKREWTFHADKAGSYQIVFTYSRPWESDDRNNQVITYTINVTNPTSDTKDSLVPELSKDTPNNILVGQSFTITLEENVSTGYSWSYQINNNPTDITK